MLFFTICHIMGCFWIFSGNISLSEYYFLPGSTPDQSITNVNWIQRNNFQNLTNFQIYTIAFYFTVTTITTVGYGDVSGTNSTERYVAVLNMVMGVVIFSLVSSAITSIIQSFDDINEKEEEKLAILNKINKKFDLPIELYSQLVKEIKEQIENDD
jgi:hypothetical protein